MFDFDAAPDRRAWPGDKWGKYGGRDILPMWVADMDFAAPQPILDALQARVAHGVFGYTDPWPSLVEAVLDGIERDHGWRVDPAWLVWLPGVVTGFNLACRVVGEPGDGVLTATPVYPPFLSGPANSERRLHTCELVRNGPRWTWDWDALESACSPDTRLLLLCHPHNPVGRVFDADELTRLADFAQRHDLIICSDEIHCGLVLSPGLSHTPLAAAAPEVAARTITLMAPSKTWNIASLYCAFAVIPDATLRSRYRKAMRGLIPHVNVLGLTATEAAYRNGGPWRAALLTYLRGNAERVLEAVSTMPGVHTTPVEATYLAWLDCRDMLATRGAANAAELFEQAGVGLSDGAAFGMPGFVRLNFGCTRATLDEALVRMTRALAD